MVSNATPGTQQAFNNSALLKQGALVRLREHEARGTLLNSATAWSDGSGSPVGCLTEGTDLAKWQADLGLPSSAGLLLDTIAAFSVDAASAANFACRWLEAIPVGANLAPVAHHLLAWMLDDPSEGLRPMASDSALENMIATLASLHRSAADGAIINRAQWKTVRQQALALTDSSAGTLLFQVGQAAEAAAWDPATSNSVLADTARASIMARSEAFAQRSGWSALDDEEVQRVMQTLFEQAKSDGVPEMEIDTFRLFEAAHPARAKRLMERLEAENAIPGRYVATVGEAWITLLQESGAP